MEVLADQVDAGKITTDEQLQRVGQTYTKKARSQSFKRVDQLDSQNIPGGSWSPDQRRAVARYLREKADGHKAAAHR